MKANICIRSVIGECSRYFISASFRYVLLSKAAMSRSLKEWIGKTDDSQIPPRVRLRVFERYDGICYLSGRRITPSDEWDCDHVVALVNGGKHREFNLAPAIRNKHREKTAEDVREKSRVYHKKAKHLGIKLRKSRPFPGSRTSIWKKTMSGKVVRRP